MRDLHSHYLPNVDDGSKSIETTLKMLEKASLVGITDIMFTPHYIVDSRYISEVRENSAIFNNIKEHAKHLGVNVYLGNEVYCGNNILEYLENKKITTLNNSRYMLIEIPLYNKMNNVKNIFFELISNGITPILAHPERYTSYYLDFDFFRSLIEMGVLLQINYPSLVGTYGKKAKRMAKKLLKYKMVTFIGSDVHNESTDAYDNLESALKKIKRYAKEDYEDIVYNNFLKVINNEEIK